jgi:hypothetical protein
MADFNERGTTGTASGSARGASGDWNSEERWWKENYQSRPYARADRGFDFHKPGYRYGYENASRSGGRSWNEAENDLRGGWDKYEHRGTDKSTWEEIKDTVRDAWDRVTGDHHDSGSKHRDNSSDRRTY